MNGRPFSFADAEEVFGPECAELVARRVAEAPRFSPEQILRGQRLFATFGKLRRIMTNPGAGAPAPPPAVDIEGGIA